MPIRQSVQGVSSDPDSLELLRSAYAFFKQTPDERGFDWFAGVHGLPLPSWCEHGFPLFLPWHRAYLYYYELALQTRLGPSFTVVSPREPAFADIGLPWWDWSSQTAHAQGLPPAFADEEVEGVQNPLAFSVIGSCPTADARSSGVWSAALTEGVRNNLPGLISNTDPPRTVRDADDPDELPRKSTIDNIVLRQPTYQSFSNSLEQVHGDVHVWVGGSMSEVLTAAYDPIFWSHHAMVDRLWYLWQNSELGVDPSPSLLSMPLAPFPITVADVLDISNLNYEYAVQLIG
ncbi:MAG: tyrosinase family protein [Pseudomonadota bacterium]